MIWALLISFASVVYIWWIYALLLANTEKNDSAHFEKTSIIIPCYNEEREYLIKCVDSALKTIGSSEVILVNNNSNKQETLETFYFLKAKYPELLILNQPKQGKRFAHAKGLEYATGKIIVFVDSDTILDKNAIIELNKPFNDKSVGGVTGQVLLANEKQNIVTRMINSMFWVAFNIKRRSVANAGFMHVMPGALSAYRKEDLLKLEEGYLNQLFAGRQCNISDDRYLTTRVQTRLLKKIKFNPLAKSYTFMPSNIFKFWKTLERWQRGALRETFLLLKEPNKSKNKALVFDVCFNFVMINLILIFKIFLFYNIFINFSWMYLSVLLFWILFMNIFQGAYMVVYKPSLLIWKFLYALFYEFFWSFSYIHAWINIQKQGMWSTR